MDNKEFMRQCLRTIDSVGSRGGQKGQFRRLEVMSSIFVELEQARLQFPAFNSFHEAYGIIKEELDEFWDEVKEKPYKGRFYKMQCELIQTAAMCVRAILDLELKHAKEGPDEEETDFNYQNMKGLNNA